MVPNTNKTELPLRCDEHAYPCPALEFRNPELHKFLDHWNEIRGVHEFPNRKAIILRAIQSLLPWVHMYNVDGDIFRFRLLGTEIAKIFPPMDYLAEPVTISPPMVAERLIESLRLVKQNRSPMRRIEPSSSIPGYEYKGSESCFVPFSSNGTDIDMISAITMLDFKP